MQCAICNMQYAICNMQYATCNMQHAACNKQHATCNMQHETWNMQYSIFNMQFAILGKMGKRSTWSENCWTGKFYLLGHYLKLKLLQSATVKLRLYHWYISILLSYYYLTYWPFKVFRLICVLFIHSVNQKGKNFENLKYFFWPKNSYFEKRSFFCWTFNS